MPEKLLDFRVFKTNEALTNSNKYTHPMCNIINIT